MKELWTNLKFAWKYAKKEKGKIISYIFFNFFQIGISVVVPILSSKLIVNLTSNKLKQVLFIAIILFFVEIFRNIIMFFVRYFSQVVYRETFKAVQFDLGKSILRLKNSCIDENSSGVFIQRLLNDTSKIADIFNVLNSSLLEIMTNIGIFIALLIIDYRIFFFMMIVVLITTIMEKKRVFLVNKGDKEFREYNEKVSGFIGELVRGVRDIKMLSAEKSFLKELDGRLITLNNKRYEIGNIQRKYRMLIGSTRDFFDLLMICLLLYLISTNEITIAMGLVAHNYMGRISYIANEFSYLLENVKSFNLSVTRIFAIMSDKEFPKEKFGKKHLDIVKGNFEFKNVSFGYNDGSKVLDNISFKVKANSTVAFVGKSGAGKSTIFSLLCKMYDVNDGVITIDGVNIKELDKESIRDNITIISQNPYIFNLSIRDNLRLVKSDMTDEEMIRACKLACLDEFINTLPDGYDTVIGEGGINLSGGQRQRMAIARAFIQDTEIILFDEATSALDNETQAMIQQAIENMQEKYTIMIIAHRLSTIVNCDRILVLSDGKIIADGNHEKLLKECDEYKKLYDSEIEKY